MLRCIKVFFSFARSRNYLPEERNTAADSVRLVKNVSNDYSIFTPKQMETILHNAPPRLIPILAIEAFSGAGVATSGSRDGAVVVL